ncbi:MAG: sialate O-acetylesterase, partial [Bacteroidales bacterium]
ERFANLALFEAYNKSVLPSGPLYSNAVFNKDHVIVSFDYADGLNTSDGKEPACFEIADESGVFYPAQAQITGTQVKVWSKKVRAPKYVRYAWQPFTRANLVNKAGYPASTFETSPLQ